jgi:hypothetical protein
VESVGNQQHEQRVKTGEKIFEKNRQRDGRG